MSNGYMTQKKYNDRKILMRYETQDCSLIKDLYPEVTEVVIEYTTSHLSPFGKNSITHKQTYSPNEKNIFEINCPNRECSIGYFNLKNEIRDMVHHRQTEKLGTMECDGYEAYDHLNERCCSSLEYKISIAYYDNGK